MITRESVMKKIKGLSDAEVKAILSNDEKLVLIEIIDETLKKANYTMSELLVPDAEHLPDFFEATGTERDEA